MSPTPYLTPSQCAAELGLSEAEVLALIKDDQLAGVRLGADELVITRGALVSYQRRLAGSPLTPPPVPEPISYDAALERFVRRTGMTPAQWRERWQREELEDSAENMELTLEAGALFFRTDEQE